MIKNKRKYITFRPAYNGRQYGANYHILNTIAKFDTFVPKGKTGLGEYYRSNYCKKREELNSFTELLKNAQFKYIFLSYNNEGLMCHLKLLKKQGSDFGNMA